MVARWCHVKSSGGGEAYLPWLSLLPTVLLAAAAALLAAAATDPRRRWRRPQMNAQGSNAHWGASDMRR